MSKRKRKVRVKKRYFRRNPPLTRSHTWTWPLLDIYHYQNNPQALNTTTACGPFLDGTISWSLVGTDSVTYSENIPSWRKAIAKGVSATTSLVGLRYYVKTSTGTAVSDGTDWRCQHSTNTGTLTAYPLSFNDPGAGTNSAANNLAKSRLLGSYMTAKNTWRGGNFLAEVGETIHMLAHPLKSFYHETWRFAGTVKGLGKTYRKVNDYGKALADAWLAYSFGVKPLLNDINDASQALNELKSGLKHDTMPLKGHGKSTVIVSDTIVNIAPHLYLGDKFDSRKLVKSDYDVRYYGAVSAGLEHTDQIFERFGISLDDIVPAIWEAIPWSFFIDYFTNTGEMLDSMRLSHAKVGWLNVTVRNSGIVQISPPWRRAHTTPTNSDMSCGRAWSLVVRVNRSPLGSIPYPDWHFKTPNFPSLKWLNMAALAQQIRSSRPVQFRHGD